MANPISSPCLATLLLLHLFFILVPSPASSATRTSLNRGSFLSVDDDSHLLTSPDKSFTCGFYQVGNNSYCFAIWFTNSADRTAVWMANRDRPVNGRGSRLSLQGDGNLVLTDVDGSLVWRANASSTDAHQLELWNSGNLVLRNASGAHLWESFHYPTDTLLPSQAITKGKNLVSASRQGAVSSGYYSLFFDSDNVIRLLYDGPEISSIYWPDPNYKVWENGRTAYNSSRIGVLDETGRFLSSDRLEFRAFDEGIGIKRRLTLDYDGNFRLYSLNESSGSWMITWEALAQQCNIHGLCGGNGVCVYTPLPKCSCPVGYEMRDPRDWFQGCKPKFNRSCDPEEVTFVEIAHSEFYGYDINYTEGISLEKCKEICAQDCSCKAFQYRLNGGGQCYPKNALYNGYQSPGFFGNTYLTVPRNLESPSSLVLKEEDPDCRTTEAIIGSPNMYKRSKEKNYNYLYWFVSAMGAIEFLFIGSGWWYLFRKRGVPISVEQGYRAISKQFRRFTYGELKKATNKFKEELGRGGSGVVYKGVLDDARVVAIKKLADVIQGEDEFWAEMSTIGTIYHMNLVRMWGYCSEAAHRLLVYEYVHNGSLAKHLFSSSSSITSLLGWDQRFKIAVGTAKGLAYLHHECLEWVIHCDVKPENILLDSDFEAKIADFGLAKLTRRGGSASNVSRMRGTKGYMAPEWASNLPITAKVDVFSYGVVLLEIVKGSRISNWVLEGEEAVELRRIISLAKSKIESGEDSWIRDFVDPRLIDKFKKRQAVMMISVALSCVEEDRNKRPTMDVVVQNLLEVEDERAVSTLML